MKEIEELKKKIKSCFNIKNKDFYVIEDGGKITNYDNGDIVALIYFRFPPINDFGNNELPISASLLFEYNFESKSWLFQLNGEKHSINRENLIIAMFYIWFENENKNQKS